MKLGPLLVGQNPTANAGNTNHVILGIQLRDVRVRFVSFSITTDATATTRTPYITSSKGTIYTSFCWSAHTQAATLTYLYLLAPHMSNFTLGTNIRGTAAQEFWVPAGCELRLYLNGGQAGDTHGSSSILYQEVLQW